MAAVEVVHVPQAVRVNAALRNVAGALGVQAIVQDGKQSGLDGFALFLLFLTFSALAVFVRHFQRHCADLLN